LSKTSITKLNVITQLKELFKAKELELYAPERDAEGNVINEDIPIEEQHTYLDPSNVCCFIPKKQWVLKVLTTLFEVGKPGEIPKLTYLADRDEEILSQYSTEYLRVVLELTKHYDAIKIQTRKDYPIKVITPDFDWICAPRIDTD